MAALSPLDLFSTVGNDRNEVVALRHLLYWLDARASKILHLGDRASEAIDTNHPSLPVDKEGEDVH